jgi:virulence-associated protein VapD
MKKSYMYHTSTAAKFFNKDKMFWSWNGLKYLACLVLLIPINSNLQSQGVPQEKAPVPMEELVRKTLKENGQTLRFLENKGQVKNPNVLYYFNGKQGSVYIEKNKIRFIAQEYVKMEDESFKFDSLTNALPEVNNVLKSLHTFTLEMDGANPLPNLKLGDSFGTRYNFFQDLNPKNWVSGVHAAKDLTLEEIYPGIGLRLYSTKDGALEFDWIMKPGADYEQIKLKFTGQDNLKIDKDGGLTVGLRFSDVKFNIPESYQVTENGKIPVKMTFKENEDNIISFHTKSKLDAQYPLIIDPTLNWGTFMDDDSGTFDEYLYAIQIDTLDGVIYCAGATNKNITVNVNPNDTVSYEADGWRNVITWPTNGGNGGGSNTGESVAIVYRVNSSGTLLMDLTL